MSARAVGISGNAEIQITDIDLTNGTFGGQGFTGDGLPVNAGVSVRPDFLANLLGKSVVDLTMQDYANYGANLLNALG